MQRTEVTSGAYLEYYDKISEEYQSLELSDELTAKLQMELDAANRELRFAVSRTT